MRDVPTHQVEAWLYAYPVWQRQLQNLHTQLEEFPDGGRRFRTVPSFGKGTVKDVTYERVAKRLEFEEMYIHPLEVHIQILENALLALTSEELRLVKCKYFERMNNALIWESLFISRRAFYRKRAHVLRKLFEALGGEGAPIWSQEWEEEVDGVHSSW